MRILTLCFTTFLILTPISLEPVHVQDNTINSEKDVPSYAKWGRLAMEKTKEKYPDTQIVDYLHRGNEVKGNTTIEKFKLWLEDDGNEFGVFIDIKFNSKTEEVITITFKESPR